MNFLKSFVLFNWQQKLYSLLVAILIWVSLKEQIEPGTLDQFLTNIGWSDILYHLGWTTK